MSYSLGESCTSSAPARTSRRTRSTLRSPLVKVALGALLLQAMAQGGAQAGHQLVGAERLGDIVVGAGVERGDLGRLVAAARQHDDRHRRALADAGRSTPGRRCRAGRDRAAPGRAGDGAAPPAPRRRSPPRACDSRARPGSCAAGGGSAARPRRSGWRRHRRSCGGILSETGQRTMNSAPLRPSADRGCAAAIVPPWASTKPLAMASPSPVPARRRSPASAR